jgi:leucyl/phenylalanyl-tRNA---protein transferase
VELPSTPWVFPDPAEAPDELVGVGADLEPGTVLTAYTTGLFPMPWGRDIGWWSPDPRGIFPLDGLRVTRSLRRSLRRFEVTVDRDFDAVIEACAEPDRPHGWIDPRITDAYQRLHRLGWAHSVECRREGRLVGGLYGISIGGLFAGESMFHREADASKVALVHLVELLLERGGRLLDVQWQTPHLERLGAIAVPRADYLLRLAEAVKSDPVEWPAT